MDSKGEKIDSDIFEDLLRKMTVVQRRTISKVFKKYGLMMPKQDLSTQTEDYEQEQIKALEDEKRALKKEGRDLKLQMIEINSRAASVENEFAYLTKKHSGLNELYR